MDELEVLLKCLNLPSILSGSMKLIMHSAEKHAKGGRNYPFKSIYSDTGMFLAFKNAKCENLRPTLDI